MRRQHIFGSQGSSFAVAVSRRVRRVAAIAALVTLAPIGSAYAGDVGTAEHLFKEGLAAMKRADASGKIDDYRAACDAFGGSVEADPSVGGYINLGLCSEKQGKLASAWAAYSEAANLALKKDPPEPARAQTAQAEAARLAPKLQKLFVTAKAPRPNGLTVTRDGATIPAVSFDAGSPIDPGEHTIEVSAKGKKTWTHKITVASTGNARIEIPVLEDLPAETNSAPGGADYHPPVVTSDGSGQRTVGVVVGGAGILALLAAGGVQVLALNEADKRDDKRAEANRTNDPAQRAELERTAKTNDDAAKNNQLIAIVTGAGGVVLLGVGAVLFFTAPKAKSSSGKTQFTPVLGPGYAGAGFGGTF